MPERFGPESRRSSCLPSEGRRQYVDSPYGAFRDWIEVMIVRRARGGVERFLGSEVVEGERFELTLVIAMEASHPRTSEGLTVFADRNAYESVEFGYGPLSSVDDFVLCFKELNRDESRVFVDEEGGVSVPAESGGVFHLFEVDMQVAGLRSRNVKTARMRRATHLGRCAVDT